VHGAGGNSVAPHTLPVDRHVEAVEPIAGESDVLRAGKAVWDGDAVATTETAGSSFVGMTRFLAMTRRF
jgi:hypothetical protein